MYFYLDQHKKFTNEMLELCQNLYVLLFGSAQRFTNNVTSVKKLILKWHIRYQTPVAVYRLQLKIYINIFLYMYLALLRNYHVKVGFQYVEQDYRTVPGTPIHMHVQSVQK